MSELLDTLMNLFVFAFIGLLIWLYFKEPLPGSDNEKESDDFPSKR
jgi:hypothetical protein